MPSLLPGQAPVNSRQAEANAIAQSNKLPAGTVVNPVQANQTAPTPVYYDTGPGGTKGDVAYYNEPSTTQNVDANGNPESRAPILGAGNHDSTGGALTAARNATYADQAAGQKTTYNALTGITAAATPALGPVEQRKQANLAKLAAIDAMPTTKTIQTGVDSKTGAPTYSTVPDPAAAIGKEQLKRQEKTRQQTEDQNLKTNQEQQTKDTQTSGGSTQTPTNPATDPVLAAMQENIALETDPKQKALLKLAYAQEVQDRAIAAKEKKDLQDQETKTATDKQTALDTAAANKAATDAQAQKDLETRQAFDAKQEEYNKQVAENARQDALDTVTQAHNQATFNEQIAYHNQSVQNDETEMMRRRMAAKLGINYDTGGLQYLVQEKQKGIDALTQISGQMALNDVNFSNQALKIGRDYQQNISQITGAATQEYNAAVKERNDTMRTAKQDYSATTNSINEYYQTLNDKYVEKISAIDQKTADRTSGAVKELQTAFMQSMSQKRQEEQQGMTQYLAAAKLYPAGQIPQDILDNLNKAFPTMKFSQGGPTLAQINGKRSGAGLGGGTTSGGFVLSAHEMQSGQPLSFAEFSQQQAAVAKNNTNLSLEDVKKATDPVALKAAYKDYVDHFSARKIETGKYDPSQISKDWDVRKMQIKSVAEMKSAQSSFDAAMKKGDYAQAYRLTYSTGPAIAEADLTQLNQMKMARQVLPELNQTLRQLAASGKTGPGIGNAVKKFDPWNKAMQDLDTELTIFSRAEARGVMGEKGRLAFQELQNLKNSLPNQSFTTVQALSSLQKIAGYIDTGLTNFVQSQKDAGKNIADTQATIEQLRQTNPLSFDAPVKPQGQSARDKFFTTHHL